MSPLGPGAHPRGASSVGSSAPPLHLARYRDGPCLRARGPLTVRAVAEGWRCLVSRLPAPPGERRPPTHCGGVDRARTLSDILDQSAQLADALERVEAAAIPNADPAGGLAICAMVARPHATRSHRRPVLQLEGQALARPLLHGRVAVVYGRRRPPRSAALEEPRARGRGRASVSGRGSVPSSVLAESRTGVHRQWGRASPRDGHPARATERSGLGQTARPERTGAVPEVSPSNPNFT